MRIADLAGFLQETAMFSSLSEPERDAIADKLSLSFYRLGETVFRAGDPADGMYIVYSGKVRVLDDTAPSAAVTLAVLSKGDCFGERALLHNVARAQTVRAAGAAVLLKFGRAEFDALLARHPEIAPRLEERVRHDTEFNFLRRLGLLSHLTPDKIQTLLQRIDRVHLEPGEFLFHEGDTGQAAYIVRDGRLQIVKETGQARAQLAVVGSGDLVGELSLLFGQPRMAGAVALTSTNALVLTRELFDEVVSADVAREVVHRQATNRLLQDEALLGDRTEGSAERATTAKLEVSWQQVDDRLFAPAYPVAHTTTPSLAGLACLMMIDAVNRRAVDIRPALQRQIEAASAETLLTVSRKAEERGYLTRLLRLDAQHLDDAPTPGIIETTTGLAVVYRVSKTTVTVADPQTGLRLESRTAFEQSWDGRLLAISYVPNFGLAGQKVAAIVQRFVPLARPYLPLIAAAGLISLLVALFGLAAPLFSQILVDDVLVHGDRSLLGLLLLGMLFVTGFQLCAGGLQDYLVAHVMRRLTVQLQVRFLHHILWLPTAQGAAWQVGDLQVRFGENEKLLQLAGQTGLKVIVNSVLVVVYVVILIAKNGTLGAVASAFLVGFAILTFVSSPLLRAADRRVFARHQAVESHVIEAVTGIQTIKALAIEDTTFDRGFRLIADLKAHEFKLANLTFSLGQISGLLSQSATVIILGYGAQLALGGSLTVGELVAFNALFGATLAPLMSLVKVWDELQEIRVILERTGDVLNAAVEEQPADAIVPAVQGRVELKNVAFRYPNGQHDTLSDITLDVLPGQKVALVGRSGSGKTTLANLLLGLYQQTRGTILVDGVDLDRVHKAAFRRQVGVVDQHPFLFSGTIRENIAKANPAADLENVVAASTIAGAHAFVSELPLGYDTQIGERGMTLSGGQRQRVAIARAIFGNPRMLVLDEATSSLDTESERLIQKNLDSIMAGRTAFVIAQRLSTVRNADQIVVLDKGRIVETGTHDSLMDRRGLYHYLNTGTAGGAA